jgi:hypothetical protein
MKIQFNLRRIFGAMTLLALATAVALRLDGVSHLVFALGLSAIGIAVGSAVGLLTKRVISFACVGVVFALIFFAYAASN